LPGPFASPLGALSAGSPALLPLGLSTAGEANEALPFGLSMGELQTWTLVYLGLSSLAFVVVWVVGYFRRSS
jgi:hypothetical protein